MYCSLDLHVKRLISNNFDTTFRLHHSIREILMLHEWVWIVDIEIVTRIGRSFEGDAAPIWHI